MYSTNETVRMVLVDGSAIVRAGIRRLLADVPQIEIVGESASAEGAVNLIGQTQPDMIMTDFLLQSGTAIDVLREAGRATPRPICIVYTIDTDANTRAISYASGADVFYDKTRDMTPLFNMIQKLAIAMLDNHSHARHAIAA